LLKRCTRFSVYSCEHSGSAVICIPNQSLWRRLHLRFRSAFVAHSLMSNPMRRTFRQRHVASAFPQRQMRAKIPMIPVSAFLHGLREQSAWILPTRHRRVTQADLPAMKVKIRRSCTVTRRRSAFAAKSSYPKPGFAFSVGVARVRNALEQQQRRRDTEHWLCICD